MIKAVKLLKEGEQELFMVQHPIPRNCKYLGLVLACNFRTLD